MSSSARRAPPRLRPGSDAGRLQQPRALHSRDLHSRPFAPARGGKATPTFAPPKGCRPPPSRASGQRTTCPRAPQEYPAPPGPQQWPAATYSRPPFDGGKIHRPATRPLSIGCSCLSRQARLWSTYASKIEPGQGGGRLMGLDGHQAPPIPSRPIVRKPRPSQPAGFSFWVRVRNCAVGSGAYRRNVQDREAGAASSQRRKVAGEAFSGPCGANALPHRYARFHSRRAAPVSCRRSPPNEECQRERSRFQ